MDGRRACGTARALGGQARPAVRRWRETAGGAGRGDRAPHRARTHVVAGARAGERRDATVVHSSHFAAGGAAAAHRGASGRDARCRPRGRGATGVDRGRLREAIFIATRRYAKRQETWFRHQLRGEREAGSGTVDVWTLDASEPPQDLADQVVARWRERAAPRSPLPSIRS
ncbi:MAG: hypothetical protein DMD67_15060 [Gemmatimonadetes bacterium]|nr:MAG: hypothetical protein DMD67_15060 [Gemmatimonadota bacterium]